MKKERFSQPEKWILLGIPALFIIGSLMHFLYDLTGQIAFVGMFAPVNESVWEHLKMVLITTIAWWGIYYSIKCEEYNIDKDKWFFGCLVSLLASMLTMAAFYYTYTGAFGIESLILDIFDLLLSVAVGQLLGLHVYKYSKGIKAGISLFILAMIVILFAVFTFYPPHIPLFISH